MSLCSCCCPTGHWHLSSYELYHHFEDLGTQLTAFLFTLTPVIIWPKNYDTLGGGPFTTLTSHFFHLPKPFTLKQTSPMAVPWTCHLSELLYLWTYNNYIILLSNLRPSVFSHYRISSLPLQLTWLPPVPWSLHFPSDYLLPTWAWTLSTILWNLSCWPQLFLWFPQSYDL